jgi:hypothetical protein
MRLELAAAAISVPASRSEEATRIGIRCMASSTMVLTG